MANAKVIALRARPCKSAQLCFEAGGVLGDIGAALGSTVTAFDFATFYAGLGTTAVGDASLLAFDSHGVLADAAVGASALASLRAEPLAAALDRAVVLRQNAYYARYSDIANIAATARSFYGPSPTAKPSRLANLSGFAQVQADQLQAAYAADGRLGVVRNTTSALDGVTKTTDNSSGLVLSNTTGSSASNSNTRATGQSTEATLGDSHLTNATFQTGGAFPGPPGGFTGTITDASKNVEATTQEGTSTSSGSGTETGNSFTSGNVTSSSVATATAIESQDVRNTDYSYRVPAIENQAQNERAQISLIDQQYTQFLANQTLPYLPEVMTNELRAIDLGVYQLQVGFLNTVLLSPIGGVVTGLYKNPGDSVRPGEPVLRVEDNSTIYLLASLIYRGGIALGATLSVTTNLFDAGGTPVTVSGAVVGVTGRSADDQWDVVVQCTNPVDGSGKPTFPIGYVFDYDNTTVTIS